MKKAFVCFSVLMSPFFIALAGCEKDSKFPKDDGVCYHIAYPKSGEMRTNILAKDVTSLENCAVLVFNRRREIQRMSNAGEVTEGLYQGNFLYADNRSVRYSKSYNGMSYPFLVLGPNNRLIVPGAIVQEKEPREEEPTTVIVPDNLPKKP